MKNNEKLLNIIGDMDEQLIPELTHKKKSKRPAIFAVGGGVCAAALMGAIVLHGISKPDIPTSTGDVMAGTTASIQDNTEPPKSTATNSSTTIPPDEPDVSEESSLPIISDEEYAKILEEHRIYPEYELPTKTDANLPHITTEFQQEGMGYGGIWVYDISEYDTPNPWSEDIQLSSLPVFKNLSYTGLGGISIYLTEEQMLTMAENVASSLGMTGESTEIEKLSDIMGAPPPEYADKIHLVYRVVAECSEVTITIYGDGEITVEFKEPVRLPENYSFTYNDTDDEQGEKTIAYIAERLRGLLQYDEPIPYTNNDRNIYQEQSRDYYVYDRSDDIIQDILNFNLKFAKISPNGDGELCHIRMCDVLTCSEYLGDYSIITEQEARTLLLNGNCIPTVSSESIEEKDIAKVELIYRTDEYIQPYYRYYVDTTDSSLLDAERRGDMKEYCLYYVPAVSSEYLEDLTVWDGVFNK